MPDHKDNKGNASSISDSVSELPSGCLGSAAGQAGALERKKAANGASRSFRRSHLAFLHKRFMSGSGQKPAIALMVAMSCYFGYLFYIDCQFGKENIPAEIKPYVQAQDFEIGSYVKFGNYPHESGMNPMPIDWLVLDNDGQAALLISKNALDCIYYHGSIKSVTWRDCSLREWLNHEFAHTAFNDDELDRIAESVICTEDNPDFGTKGCGETTDKIFCLSIDEAKKYFASDEARKCRPDDYAVSHLAYRSSDGYCSFWLRSPGDHANSAACVLSNGSVDCKGRFVDIKGNSVRPALRVIL